MKRNHPQQVVYQKGTLELPVLPTLTAGSTQLCLSRNCGHLSLITKHGFQMCKLQQSSETSQ
eukprot:6050092-Amphidinium_carterae.1